MLTFNQTFVDCKSTVFEVVPESKEGESNEEAQGSAKVRHHGYKIIIVNLKVIKGIVPQEKFYCPSLIFWIVTGCGEARFSGKGQKTT